MEVRRQAPSLLLGMLNFTAPFFAVLTFLFATSVRWRELNPQPKGFSGDIAAREQRDEMEVRRRSCYDCDGFRSTKQGKSKIIRSTGFSPMRIFLVFMIRMKKSASRLRYRGTSVRYPQFGSCSETAGQIGTRLEGVEPTTYGFSGDIAAREQRDAMEVRRQSYYDCDGSRFRFTRTRVLNFVLKSKI